MGPKRKASSRSDQAGAGSSEEIADLKKRKVATKSSSHGPVSESGVTSTSWWLFKSEPEEFSIADLEASPAHTHHWDGVRNYQARNFMRGMKVGDRGFFYHSNAGAASGIVGTVTVVREAYPDPSCLDPKSKYYDPKSTKDDPRWSMMDVRLDERWARPVLLSHLRDVAASASGSSGDKAARGSSRLSAEQVRAIAGMKLLQRGMRLSVQPLTQAEWEAVAALKSSH